jgi:signal peptidase II
MALAPSATAPAARRSAFVRAGAVMLLVVAVDQLTKHLVVHSIGLDQVVKVLPGIELVYWRNAGVAFSFLSSGGATVYVLGAIALGVLISYLYRRPQLPWLWLPSGMLLGGAVGNLIDRVRTGAVTDFIKLPHWPAFNVADMSITFGMIGLIFVIEAGRGR